MIQEITAKTLLSSARQPDPWFGIKYTMNLYRGCQHQCIYCDSRSECYQIADFEHDVLVKVNALDLLRDELPCKRVKGTVGTGSMNDPYMPLEAQRGLTRGALAIIAALRFPVHIITKSDLVLRDRDLLADISQVYAAVSFTVTAADDALSQQVEPAAPSTSRRFAALAELVKQGIYAGVTMMPILPFVEDNRENIAGIVAQAAAAGAQYILPAFGMTLRDRQRAYYYDQLDRRFPGLRPKYEARFGEKYSAAANDARKLERLCGELCARHGIATRMRHYQAPPPGKQLALF
jgi:DNA repair photolyase